MVAAASCRPAPQAEDQGAAVPLPTQPRPRCTPAAPCADDLVLSLSAKQKVKVQRSQEVVRSRLLLRNNTQAAVAANYDYNLRTE